MLMLAALSLPLFAVLLAGLALGAVVNWAVYRLAWHRREISPWGPTPTAARRRRFADRIPVVGWWGLRREHALHGRGFWLRPLGVELMMGVGLAALYWWEVDRLGLVLPQVKEQLQLVLGGPVALAANVIPVGLAQATFLNHALLISLMAAASFIDIDEKIIPDEITLPGTLLGLLLAALLPLSLLPQVALRDAPPSVGERVLLPPAAAGVSMFVEPTTLAAPNPWPAALGGAPRWRSLALGQACWWLWCFALTPRIWRGRHGFCRALAIVLRRVLRELARPPLGVIALVGSLTMVGLWWRGGAAWIGLLTALVGMAVSGAMVWIVRLVGTAALRREAMGFGDVTLMMMIGAFLGWQAGVLIFFVAPLAGLVVGVLQLLLRRGDVIPYGPFLCLAALVVLVRWTDFWTPNLQNVFRVGWLVPIVLLVGFGLLGLMLAVWQQIKLALFGRGAR